LKKKKKEKAVEMIDMVLENRAFQNYSINLFPLCSFSFPAVSRGGHDSIRKSGGNAVFK